MTIKLPRRLSQRVARVARQRHVSRSTVVREALDRLLDTAGEETFIDRVAHHLGAGRGLPRDLSSNPRHLAGMGR